jgi:hypothetical protein
MVGNYCANRVLARTRSLDEMARNGNLKGARELIPELKIEIDRLRDSLDRFRRTLEGR